MTLLRNRMNLRLVGFGWAAMLVLLALGAGGVAVGQLIGGGGRACVTDVGAPRFLCRDDAYTGRATADVTRVEEYDGDPFTLDDATVPQPDWVVDLAFTADGRRVAVTGLQWTASAAPVAGGTVRVAYDPTDPDGAVTSAELLDVVRPGLPQGPRRVSPELLVLSAGAAVLAVLAVGATAVLARVVDVLTGRRPPHLRPPG